MNVPGIVALLIVATAMAAAWWLERDVGPRYVGRHRHTDRGDGHGGVWGRWS